MVAPNEPLSASILAIMYFGDVVFAISGALTAGQVIDDSTRKPRIYYRLLEERVRKTRASFLYEGTIEVEDAPHFTRRWLIIARKENKHWRVSNFTEY